MKAVILAGGKGARLLPYTTVLPKPLVPVGDMPILEVVIRQLISAGFTEIVITLGHLGELIRAFFLAHPSLTEDIRIEFVQETEPTGTAGSLTLVPHLDKPFLTMNGDILTTLDYRELVEHHRENGADLTIACHRKHVTIDLGVLTVEDGRVTDYTEKPAFTYPVSMGVYVYDPSVLRFIPKNTYLDFPTLVLRLLEAGRPVAVYETDCQWLDIGRHEDHAEAQRVFENHREEFGV